VIFPVMPFISHSHLSNSIAPNQVATVGVNASGKVTVRYAGSIVFQGKISIYPHVKGRSINFSQETVLGPNQSKTQILSFMAPRRGDILKLEGTVFASDESFANQSQRSASNFQFIRNEIGPSHNLLNNGVYDRFRDWNFNGSLHRTHIYPISAGGTQWKWKFSTANYGSLKLEFQPAVYRRHKNIRYFHPWTYKAWPQSVTGWCSWWAYRDSITEADVQAIDKVFAAKLSDYGYNIIQIDDGYEAGLSGSLADWLKTNEKFPSGLAGLEHEIKSAGLVPGLWINIHFNDPATLKEHPDWFIQDAQGQPHKGPWIEYALNPDSALARKSIIIPHLSALRDQGWRYVKIDTLRHFLYDSMYPSREFLKSEGQTPEHLLREYMRTAREILGQKTYILACWGVLPEVVDYADGCRLGTDGFGPSTLQQYSSWNNVVWKNDPDHCDLEPYNSKTKQYETGQERIRATLVAMAGAQLLLSDHPDVYEKPAALDAARRVSPIPFTLPGQLFDFDPTKSDSLIKNLRNQNGGSNPGPIDADQFGKTCPYWALDINKPYESWMVLAHINWSSKPANPDIIKFSDLGLDPDANYLISEGWTQKFLGNFHGSFQTLPLEPNGVACYAIRKLVDHPQIITTNRHITQGAEELQHVVWDSPANQLKGTVKLVKGFPYQMLIHVPKGYSLEYAKFGDLEVATVELGSIDMVSLESQKNTTVDWNLKFLKSHSQR